MLLLAVAATLALAAFLQATSGFGFSLISVPVISMLFGPAVAVVATSTVGVLLTLSLVVGGRRHMDLGIVRIVAITAVVGMPAGLWILTHLDARVLSATIAVVVLALGTWLSIGGRLPRLVGLDLAAAMMSAVLATSTGTNGPPLVALLHARNVDRRSFRATLNAAFLLQGIGAVVGFTLARRFTVTTGAVIAVGVPAVVVGRLSGERVFDRLDHRRFRRVVLAVLLATGVASLMHALA
jgi:uncharacterized membrane protein YfcA